MGVWEKLNRSLPWNKFERKNTAEHGLPHRILVGTHHKTGSLWMRNLFMAICDEYSLLYGSGEQKDLPSAFDVFFQDHSQFDFKALGKSYRALHLIRDPRDIIISGAFYHQHSKEAWLHEPMPFLNGQSYQYALNRCVTLEDKILFEMEYAGRHTVGEMLAWDYRNPRVFEAKYEDLIVDAELRCFRKIFAFLGFSFSQMERLLDIAYANSLFSGQISDPEHIRSGRPQQWEIYFNENHKKRFRELFGDALIRLGYEKNQSW